MKGKSGSFTDQMYKNVNRRKRRNSSKQPMFTRSTRTDLSISKRERSLQVYKSWRDADIGYERGDHSSASAQVGPARAPAGAVTRADRRGPTWRLRGGAGAQPRRQPHRLHPSTGAPRARACERPAATQLGTAPLAAGLPLRLHIHDPPHLHGWPDPSRLLLVASPPTACNRQSSSRHHTQSLGAR